ncbi:DUF58 domain-containing protein [Timonella sp. A28]|uniref:DUF58 domain-containing protein n=1 Tax=Timonella sp. A28 TaxID=3442640 RepID=UPI003EB8ED67
MVLTWRPAALMLLGILPCALVGAWLAFYLWIIFVVVVCAVDVYLTASPRQVSIERTVPFQARLSESATIELVVKNTSSRRARGLLRDAWQPSAGALGNVIAFDLATEAARRFTYRISPTRRGDRRVEHVTVRLWGPLKCAGRQLTFFAPASVKVLPEFKSRKHLPSRLARLRELEGESAVQIRGAGTEFDSLREYVEGDDVRSIDWRATARSRKVTVRTYRPERDRRVVIVVDTSRTSAPRIGDETRLDTYIESALLLAALASRAGDRVELIAFDRTTRARVSSRSSSQLMKELAQSLSGVESSLIEADWTALNTLITTQISQRSLVVVLSNSDITNAGSGVLSSIGALAKRHLVVLAGVSNPDVAELTEHRADSSQVFEAAAAERTLLEEHAGSDILASIGVVVLKALPEQLAPSLSDTYLDLKAAGRL